MSPTPGPPPPGVRAGSEVTAGEVVVTAPPRPLATTGRTPRRTERRAARVALARLVRARWRPVGADRCGSCGAGLTMPARRTVRAVTVEPPAAAPWTLEVRLLLTRCPDCAVENVPVATVPALRWATRRALGA